MNKTEPKSPTPRPGPKPGQPPPPSRAAVGPARPPMPVPAAVVRPPNTPRPASAAPAGQETPPEKGSMGTLAFSLILHGVIVAVAILFVVREIFIPAAPEAFTPPEKRVQLPAKLREQALNNAKHDAAAPRPTFSQRLASTAPGPVAVPAMPDVNLKQMLPLDPSELVSDQISGMIGASGQGLGTGRGLGGGGGTGKGSGVAFFEIRDTAKSLVIMIDVSQSMFSRTGDYDSGSRKLLREGKDQAFNAIRVEAIKLITALGPDTRFGIIRWSGSARSWRPELVRATDDNKAAARLHIETEIDANTAPPTGGRPGGTRHDYAIEELLRLNPETAFMLTDGNATATRPGGGMSPIPAKTLTDLLENAAEERETIPRIHTIYYLTGADKKEEEDMLRDIARKTKGRFRKVEAPGAAAVKKEKDKEKDKDKR